MSNDWSIMFKGKWIQTENWSCPEKWIQDYVIEDKEDKILQVDMPPAAMGSIDGHLSVLLRKVD